MKMVNGSGDGEMAGYNAKIDELREAEYPMLKGQQHLLPSLAVC